MFVVLTMVAVSVDVPIAPGEPDMPTLVLATTVSVTALAAPAAPVASAGKAVPASAVAKMAAAAFTVPVVAALVLRPDPATVMPVALPVAPDTPAVPALSPSSSDAMERDKKRVFTGDLSVC